MSNAAILLVEDDYALAMGTEYALGSEGYQVLHADCVEKARQLFLEGPDLILLDVMLPDGNGYDLCKEIRQKDPDVPIIFLTAVGEEVNIIQGLDLGADDYVTKPYRVKELMSRIAANLRRHERSKKQRVHEYEETGFYFGNHRFIKSEYRLYHEDKLVELTASEIRLLAELIDHQGQVLSRNVIMERLYDTGESFVDDNTLSVYMKRLRDKLVEDAEWIQTVRGVGYRFKRQEEMNGK